MTHKTKPAWGALLLLLGAMAVVFPQEAESQRGRDFLFKEPHFSLALNLGYGIPRAGSEIYDDVTDQLTVEKGDFNAVAFGGSFGVRALSRLEIALEVSYSQSNNRSEFRDWVDMDDLPIQQSTKLSWVPVTASVKAYLFDRGRRVSRFAWVPGSWSPFIGAGGGRVHFSFKQAGDFVDFETYDIFPDAFRSEGDAWIAHVLAGVEYSLSPAFFITGEGRYSWAEAQMDQDYYRFDPIDLSGFRATVGLAVRF